MRGPTAQKKNGLPDYAYAKKGLKKNKKMASEVKAKPVKSLKLGGGAARVRAGCGTARGAARGAADPAIAKVRSAQLARRHSFP